MRTDLKTFFVMVRQLFYIMTVKQKRKSILLFFVILVGAAFETLGVSAILPFIEAMLTPDELRQKWYVKLIIDFLGIDNSQMIMIVVGLGVICIYILKNLYLTLSIYFQASFRYRFQKELSTRMLRAYMKRPYSYYLNVNSAEVLRGIGGDVNGVFGVFEDIFKLISELLTVCLIGIFLFYTDFLMAGGVLAIAVIAFLLIVIGFKKMLTGAGEKARRASTISNKYAYQAVNGIKEILVMRRSDYFVKKYDGAYEQFRVTEQLNSFLRQCPERIIETVCVGGLIGIVCVRLGLGVDAAVFVPQLATFALAAFRILPSISRMIGNITGLIYQRPNLEVAYNNLREVEEFEKQLKLLKIADKEFKDMKTLHFNSVLNLNGIDWKYPGSATEVLHDLSLTIHKGEAIAFIGASGAGKTTLADIILGLFRPNKGSVTVDGKDIFSIPEQWAKIIGYVPQSVFLLDDTIRNNVSFGLEEESVNDEQIWQALELAQLKRFVEGLPYQLDTVVGERGIKFSGGQRQRIAIARALYYNPDILILDEATAALDNETEKAVMEAIESLQGLKTLIIVAHRLSTVKNCNKIYEIKDGKAIVKRKVEIFGND